MLGIGLKLLGVGNLIKEFFLQNWKWLIPTIALVVSFFVVSDKYYEKGRQEERTYWDKKIKESDARNRAFENRINVAISTFGRETVEEALKRVEEETIYKDRIQTIVRNNPIYTQCVVDQDVIDNRNAIREQGPKKAEYPIRIDFTETE
jgi:N-methylhydantoinase B/oxoprolinase/acetone carboxylase alpha subunit